MIDPFLILAPILFLAVIALLGFVGCAALLGIDDVSYSAPFAITALRPSTTQVLVGFNLSIDGSGFAPGALVNFGNSLLTPTPPVTSALINVQVPGTTLELANPGQFSVSVTNPGVGRPSTSSLFTVNPVPVPASVTVTFNPPPALNARDPLPIPYHNLVFGSVWFYLDPAASGGPANGVALNGPAVPSGDISFANGSRKLLRIRVFPKRATTITISDGTNPPVSKTFNAADANLVHFIDTGWTIPTATFTIGTNIGFDLIIDTIIYEGPA